MKGLNRFTRLIRVGQSSSALAICSCDVFPPEKVMARSQHLIRFVEFSFEIDFRASAIPVAQAFISAAPVLLSA